MKEKIKIYYLWVRIKNDGGSILVEAAIIYPIVLLVLFGLISATLVLHDHYVTEVGLDVELMGDYTNKESISSGNQLNDLRIINSSQLELKPKNKGDYINGKWTSQRIIYLYDDTIYPLKKLYHFQMNEVVVDYSKNSMPMIRYIDLIDDIFDTVSLPNTIKKTYDNSLTSIFEALESY